MTYIEDQKAEEHTTWRVWVWNHLRGSSQYWYGFFIGFLTAKIIPFILP